MRKTATVPFWRPMSRFIPGNGAYRPCPACLSGRAGLGGTESSVASRELTPLGVWGTRAPSGPRALLPEASSPRSAQARVDIQIVAEPGLPPPSFPDSRRVCYKHRSMLRPVGERETAIQESAGEAGSQTMGAARPAERHASNFCPACSAQLESHRCKLVCFRCGYYMSCSDFY
jgi:hypothetical protein